MADTLRDRVQFLVDRSGKKPADIVREHSLGRTLLSDILRGKTEDLTLKSVRKLAPALNTTEDFLTGKSTQPDPPEGNPRELRAERFLTRKAHVAGRVEAGSWREVDDNEGAEIVVLDVPEDEEFPNARILVFEVAGDSMNAYARAPLVEGNYAVCLAYEDVAHRFVPRDGMIVVVERTRDGGHLREWSIKELAIQDDHYEFHPRSTNPSHKPIIVPIDYDADDGMNVEIIAVLRRVITRTIQF